jgi:hypothetical protein
MTPKQYSSNQPLPPDQGLIILNCSREKLVTSGLIPAWDLYQGACVPRFRGQFADHPGRRARTRILSAAHGLLRPEDTIGTYDRRLITKAQALALHENRVSAQLDSEFTVTPELRRLLIIVEPLYLLALQRIFDHLDRLDVVSIMPDPWAWTDGLAVLTRWGWT